MGSAGDASGGIDRAGDGRIDGMGQDEKMRKALSHATAESIPPVKEQQLSRSPCGREEKTCDIHSTAFVGMTRSVDF